MASLLAQQFQQIHTLILEERDFAKNLDIDGLQRTVTEKSALLSSLADLNSDQLDPELRELAELIRKENRRNAYLFWSSLGWVRDTMNFYGRQISSKSYGDEGQQVETAHNGNLLSGKV